MSRIFDALQRSGAEQTGVTFPDTVSVATKLLQITEEPPRQRKEVPASSLNFPSVEVSVSPSGRLVFLTEPESLAAEKFRFLGVRMRELQQVRAIKKVLVTSTIADEGKSMVSANLTGVLARRKRHKVLLIEGDLRRPVHTEQFGIGGREGLAEWLRGDADCASTIYFLNGPDFWLMPAGHPPDNPMELLQSGRLATLLSQLEPLFDWIIIDSPPLLPLADTTVWLRMSDGALLVVREGTTDKNSLERGLEIVKKGDLLGVVLNASSNGSRHNYYQRYAAAKVVK
jgi:capsular exopolysaccharide synthesis family protein